MRTRNGKFFLIILIGFVTLLSLGWATLSAAEPVRMGVTRFVNPDQHFSYRWVGIELQRYLVANLREANNVRILHRRAVDQILLDTSVDGINEIYTPETITKTNEILNCHLLVVGSIDVLNDEIVEINYQILHTMTKQSVHEERFRGNIENLIPLFNEVVLDIVEGANQKYSGEEISLDQQVLDLLDENSKLTLLAYNSFLEVKQLREKGNLEGALATLESMLYSNRNQERIFRTIIELNTELKRWDTVLEFAQQLLEFKKDQIEPRTYFDYYYSLYKSAIQLGKYEKAVDMKDQLLELAEPLNDPGLNRKLAKEQADLAFSLNQYEEARAQYTELKTKLTESNTCLLTQVDIELKLASLDMSELQEANALSHYEKALELALQTEDSPTMIQALIELGLYKAQKKEGSKAQELLSQAKELADQLQDPKVSMQVNEALGDFYTEMVMYQRALQCYKEAFVYAKALVCVDGVRRNAFKVGVTTHEICNCRSPETQALVDHNLHLSDVYFALEEEYAKLTNIAHTFETFQDFDTAMKYYNLGFQIHQQIESVSGQITDKNKIAELYTLLEDYDQAFLAHSDVLSMAEAISSEPLIKDRPMMIRKFMDIGKIYRLKGELDNAVEVMQRAVDEVEEVGMKTLAFKIYYELAQLFKAKGQGAEYQNALQQAVDIGEKLGLPETEQYKQELVD